MNDVEASVIFHLLALLTGFCHITSVIYKILFGVRYMYEYGFKCSCSMWER